MRRTLDPTLAGSLLAGLSVLVLGAGSSRGEDPPVTIRGVGGAFRNFVSQGAWAQHSVTVANDTAEAFQAEVSYLTGGREGGVQEYARTAAVPPGTMRRIPLPVRIGTMSPSGTMIGGMRGVEQKYVLRNAATGQQVYVSPEMAAEMRENMLCMAILASLNLDHDEDKYLSEMPGRELGELRKVRGRVIEMPDRWYGYDRIEVLVLGGLEMERLRALQVQAILDRVRRGAVLVLTGSPAMPEMLRGPLGSAAGVAAVGVHYVDDLAAAATGKDRKDTQVVHLDWPLPMVELCPADAEVLYTANGLPLLTRRPLGQGTVFVLAVPTGAMKDTSLHPIWRLVRQAVQTRPPIDDDTFLEPGNATLMEVAGRRGPKRIVPIALLAALLAATVLGGACLRIWRRGELLWAIMVPVGIVVAVIIYVVSLFQSDPERLSFIGMVSGLEAGQARVQQVWGYYSGQKETDLSFAADSPQGVISETGEVLSGAIAMRKTLWQQDSLHLAAQRIQANGTRRFFTDSVVPARGITGNLTFGPGGLVGTLRNDFPADVTDAVLYVGRRTYRFGNLAAGRDTPVSAGPADRLSEVWFQEPEEGPSPGLLSALGEFTGAMTAPDRLRNNLLRQMVPRPGRSVWLRYRSLVRQQDRLWVRRDPVLIGRMEHSLLEPLAGGPPRSGWSVVVWPMRIVPPAPGGRAVVPEGLVRLEFDRAPVWDADFERFNRYPGPLTLRVRARLPEQIRGLEGATATLRVALGAENYRLTVAGAVERADNEPPALTPLETFDNPTGVKVVSVPQADRFLTADGAYLFALKMDRLREPRRSADLEDGANWALQFVDVTLEGNLR